MENAYTESPIKVITDPEEYDGQELAYCISDAMFYEPERELTDEELLQQLYELVSRDGFLSISREMTAQELATDGTAAGVSPKGSAGRSSAENGQDGHRHIICNRKDT